MDNPSSPLETLRQLKEMLDAGALTPTEFEALKQRLVFNAGSAGLGLGADAPAPAPPLTAPEVPPVSPPAAASPAPNDPLVTPVTVPLHSTLRDEAPASAAAAPDVPLAPRAPEVVPVPIVPAGTYEAPAPIVPRPQPVPEAPIPPQSGTETDADWATNDLPDGQTRQARSPLALILSIGGLLALLALVMYLSFNNRTSEHLSSTSQTSADTLAAPIETGPQAAPLPATLAQPETIRVAPARPAPRVQPVAPPVVRDSVAAPAAQPVDTAAGR